MSILAAIDLGSNTFHLLIVRVEGSSFVEIFRKRVYAQLAEKGIGLITESAYRRGIAVMIDFLKDLSKYDIEQVKVTGTEMLRLAPNGRQFVQDVEAKTGLPIEIISGAKEAYYIYRGVSWTMDLGATPYLIMDIGGGSVEFILVNQDGMAWADSFSIGVAVLYHHFHKNDPIGPNDKDAIYSFLDSKTSSLQETLKSYPIKVMVGASGVFETFYDLMGADYSESLSGKKLKELLHELIFSTLAQRLQMETIPKERKKMIVVSSVLMLYVLELAEVEEVQFSTYSLKEGLIRDMVADDS